MIDCKFLFTSVLFTGVAFVPYTNAENMIQGKTIYWSWTEGIVAGTTHKHIFNEDGTVSWKVIDGPQKGHAATEKEYSSEKVSDNVYVLSYLAASGNTLTVTINFENGVIVGYASGSSGWYPMKGNLVKNGN